MKVFLVMAMLAMKVFALNMIPESIFDIVFDDEPGAIVIERGTAVNNTLVRTAVNITFVGRTIANSSITDEYSLSTTEDGEVGLARRIITAMGKIGPGIMFSSAPYLEIRFEFELYPASEPAALVRAVLVDPEQPRIKYVRFLSRHANIDSTVTEVLSDNADISWSVFPPTRVYPGVSYYRDSSKGWERSRFCLQIFPATFKSTVEIIFIGTIPEGAGLISPFDPNVAIVPESGSTPPPTEEEDDDEEDPEGGEEEAAPMHAAAQKHHREEAPAALLPLASPEIAV